MVTLWRTNDLTVGQGMVDGYMVEKTYLDIAPYLGAFGAFLMPQ